MYVVVEQKRWQADKEYVSLHYSEKEAEKWAKRFNNRVKNEEYGYAGKYYEVIDANEYNINRKNKQLYLD